MKQLIKKYFFCVWLIISSQSVVLAHQSSATYLANEAILISSGDKKVLFDPFFHQTFGTYQGVPENIEQAVFSSIPPFDNLTAIVISHAHGDHFAADDVLKYMLKYPTVQLVAPKQAVTELMALTNAEKIESQVTSIQLAFEQEPKTLTVAGLEIEAVRIPHAGWPSRAEVENLVFRVTLRNHDRSITVMHLGDADPNDDHFLPYKKHWQKHESDTAFPPYWFYLSAEGNDILDEIINVKQTIGIHVPVDIPSKLKSNGADYFSIPGEVRNIDETHKH